MREQPIERIPITEEWLKQIGFKWEQFDRQPEKMWTLWLANCLRDETSESSRMFCSYEDLGIQVSWSGRFWFCWLRSDASHRYHRFIHIRHLVYQDELVMMIQGLTGWVFMPENCMYGSLETPERAEQLRKESERFDRVLMRDGAPWTQQEKDETRGRPTVQHVEAAIKGGLAK